MMEKRMHCPRNTEMTVTVLSIYRVEPIWTGQHIPSIKVAYDSPASSPRQTSKTELGYDDKKIRYTCQIINRRITSHKRNYMVDIVGHFKPVQGYKYQLPVQYLQAVEGINWEGQAESLFQQSISIENRSTMSSGSGFSGDETAPFFGFLGAAAALVFSCMGAAYGTAKSGVGVASMGVMRPELVMKSIVPVVMAGVLGIYGLIIAVIISTGINPKAKSYYLFDGYAHLSSGLACGLAGLSAGMAIGIVGDAGVSKDASRLDCQDNNHCQKLIQIVILLSKCTAAKAFCGHDSYSHLCRSSGTIWAYRWYHPIFPCWPIKSRLRRFLAGKHTQVPKSVSIQARRTCCAILSCLGAWPGVPLTTMDEPHAPPVRYGVSTFQSLSFGQPAYL
ncbi:hypothetical protein E3N88_18624 [Mikania micrantha]|uniref:V-type proton ATPase proteolipid subunit n=1 Tax=Mikania micrantha TaxID=192012 RepID=A0A5N6NNP2_9ASTR|nr:hypothetical protein E3N88_18624 [Mikania micrantha]